MLEIEGVLSDISEFEVGVSRLDRGKRVTRLGVEVGCDKALGWL